MNAQEFSTALAQKKHRISLNCPRHPGKLPKPGIYPDMSEAEYRAIPAVSQTLLKEFARSPLHAAWFLHGQYKAPTEAQKFGTAAHLRILRPDRLAGNIVIGPVNENTGKSFGRDTQTWEAAEKANPGKTVLAQEDLDKLNWMHGVAASHPAFAPVLGAKGHGECALIWIDSETGLACKALIDKYIPGQFALDYKSAENASVREFGIAAARYGYPLQAVHYIVGIRAQLNDTECEFIIAAQEKDEPFALGLYTVEESVIAHYAKEHRQLLNDLANCMATQNWPGYTATAAPLALPMWAMPVGAMDSTESADAA